METVAAIGDAGEHVADRWRRTGAVRRLADWMISLAAGATPEDLALYVREASPPLGETLPGI